VLAEDVFADECVDLVFEEVKGYIKYEGGD
jgi:hypothetical protein